MSTISTTELAQRLSDDDLTVVDVRPLAAYNGWSLRGEARGGHVPGARAFPSAWLRSVDEPEVARILEEKGVVPDRSVALVGYSADDVAAVEGRLRELGVDDVRTLEGGAQAWAADVSLPIDRLPNYDRLVTIDWLKDVLAGGTPEAAPTGRFLLFHVNFGVPEEYAEGHIAGAAFLDTNWLENPTDWNRRSPEERLIAYQMYWRGETFYTKNEIYEGPQEDRTVFDQDGADEKLKDWISRNRGHRAFFLFEHGQRGHIIQLIPIETQASFKVLDERNNKFSIAQVDL